jgi:hypothetical protein
VCLQKDANGKDVEVAHLKVGNYFGEVRDHSYIHIYIDTER